MTARQAASKITSNTYLSVGLVVILVGAVVYVVNVAADGRSNAKEAAAIASRLETIDKKLDATIQTQNDMKTSIGILTVQMNSLLKQQGSLSVRPQPIAPTVVLTPQQHASQNGRDGGGAQNGGQGNVTAFLQNALCNMAGFCSL